MQEIKRLENRNTNSLAYGHDNNNNINNKDKCFYSSVNQFKDYITKLMLEYTKIEIRAEYTRDPKETNSIVPRIIRGIFLSTLCLFLWM